ncbi:MAG: transglycosylase SLT domain-containing protein [candidate division Zixibacteria bacterium]|nr:transglycosylase SLT domain-containing protein [candidate division Zixibacteria bacterium]
MPKSALVFPSTDLERLKGQSSGNLETEKTRLRKATREFESFFMYYMLKTMRETVPDDPLAKNTLFTDGGGKETFTQMFDMEVARSVTTSSGGSIGDILYKSLEKVLEAQFSGSEETPEFIPLENDNTKDSNQLDLERDGLPLPEKDEQLKPVKIKPEMLPLSSGRRPVNEDEILSRFGKYIYDAARETELDSALIATVIKVESGGNPGAVSPAGAKGLMQLADATAGDYGVADVFDPHENIRAGSRFLKDLLARYGDLETALAAYNAGPGNVDKYGGIPPFRETREYVRKVTDLLSRSGIDFKTAKT